MGRQHRSSSIPAVTGGIVFLLWLPMRYGPQAYWHLHRSDLRANDFAHSPLVTRQGSLTVGMPDAGDFVESFEPYTSTSSRFTCRGKTTGTHPLGGQMCPGLSALLRNGKKKNSAPARYQTLIVCQSVRSMVTKLSKPASTPVIYLRWYFGGAEIENKS
jgi:hypothetical protein